MSVFSMAGSNPALPTYPLQRSVRLRSSASAYFNRTPASATNRQKYTLSLWFKRGTLGTNQALFSASDGTQSNEFLIYFDTNNALGFQQTVGGSAAGQISCFTNAVFRDPSSWYHAVIAIDTTQATSTNRLLLYINGVAQTFSSYSVGSSINTWVDNTNPHALGKRSDASLYFDGYLEEVNFIDGQQLTPSSFGAYNSYGVWSPAKYTGTYGTNGFYLNFQDNSALTTTANIGIGKDSSGNGNYWTSNNISITAGVTYDSMLDVPTLTSNTNSNYCTLNPLKNGALTVTNGNLTVTGTAATTGTVVASMGVTSGKWYWEYTVGSTDQNSMIGICTDAVTLTSYIGFDAYGWGYYGVNGNKYNNSTPLAYGASYTNGDIIGVALDADSGTLTFYKNNTSQGTAYTGLTSGPYFPAFGDSGSAATPTGSFNFGQRPFSYTPPTGFNRLCTYNLPDSIVPVGAQYMAATTYTGNGSTQAITNTVNGKSFQPDLVWIKARSVAYNNYLEDSVRGVGKDLSSNLTDAEATYNLLTAFNSNGFTAFTNGTYLASNQNGTTYVGWQWRASNASAVTNTSGSITSQVSANQTAGFSVVTCTTPASGAFTIGHGLGVAPRMIIVKDRANATGWPVYHASVTTQNEYLLLNTTAAKATLSGMFGAALPTSTVFGQTVGAGVNANIGMVAYCFAAVPGYSAFGSYTGNGSADGPFVYTGFMPRWLMVKSSSIGGAGYSWFILDSSRNTYNIVGNYLLAQASDAEAVTGIVDFLSNGFKLRFGGGGVNPASQTIIYAAFAENPFKNSLAR